MKKSLSLSLSLSLYNKRLKALIVFCCFSFISTLSFSQTANTLPTTGNVGVGTTAPNSKLQVVGNTKLGGTVQIDSTVIIKDSVTIRKRLTIKQDIKVQGKSVFTGDVKAKANLKVLGTAKMKNRLVVDSVARMKSKLVVDGLTRLNGDAKVFGDLKIKSLENLSISDTRLLLINPNGKVDAGLRLQAPLPNSSCLTVLPWSKATALDLSAFPNAIALCPSYGNVGIGVVNPLAKLSVNGTSLLQGKVGIGNASISNISTLTDPELFVSTLSNYDQIATEMTNTQQRSIFFVPMLGNNSYSLMSKQEDAGIFWSDNSASGNTNIGFVLAPKSSSEFGLRIDGLGRFSFNTPVDNNVQYTMQSNSPVGLLINTIGAASPETWGIRIVTTIDKTNPITVGNTVTPSNVDVFVVEGNGEVIIRTDPAQLLKSFTVKDITNPNNNTNDVFRVLSNGNVFATRVRVMTTPFPDYVFNNDYKLMTLSNLETYIKTNKHLPKIPTAEQVEKEGADLGEINRVLVEKVEELTLYMIAMNKRMELLEKENKLLKK